MFVVDPIQYLNISWMCARKLKQNNNKKLNVASFEMFDVEKKTIGLYSFEIFDVEKKTID